MMVDVLWLLLAMIYGGGLLGVLMAVAEKDLLVWLDREKPSLGQIVLAFVLFLAWPMAVTAVLVSAALKK